MALFTLAPFAGPSFSPTVSGFMSVAGVSWRWVFWVLTLFAGFWHLCQQHDSMETLSTYASTSNRQQTKQRSGL